jgi:hypothetical protein
MQRTHPLYPACHDRRHTHLHKHRLPQQEPALLRLHIGYIVTNAQAEDERHYPEGDGTRYTKH